MRLRRSSSGACKEIARFGRRGHFAIASIPGTTPAVETVMRRHGVPNAYDRLKDFTRGRRVGPAELREFVATLGLPPAEAARLAQLTPAAYVGLAAALARQA